MSAFVKGSIAYAAWAAGVDYGHWATMILGGAVAIYLLIDDLKGRRPTRKDVVTLNIAEMLVHAEDRLRRGEVESYEIVLRCSGPGRGSALEVIH